MSSRIGKRIIVCCDGTWQNGDGGYTKPTLIPYQPMAFLQIPSNVVRISRALKREGYDGKPQIVFYHSGVGAEGNWLDSFTGGAFGKGISENIREAYSFITTNYIPGDEIILIGFSRGAFTARSVAGLIHEIGLLTRHGMDSFLPIFLDAENAQSPHYNDRFPNQPFRHKPRHGVPGARAEYKRRLVEDRLTRVTDSFGNPIRIKAVAVWDTVGSLGIPAIGAFQKLGIPHATKELKFHDTTLTRTIEHAFQALGLDEKRLPFSPAVWERPPEDEDFTDLRQVWFPGVHSNVGGGYPDQELANVSLAWMMDQLSSIGVTFEDTIIDRLFNENVEEYLHPTAEPRNLLTPRPWSQWAIESVYQKHKPIRPWGLGKLYNSDTSYYVLSGQKVRTPGRYMRCDPSSGEPSKQPMVHTNERIHSSVRIRLDLEGLGPDDVGLYKCPALLGTKGQKLWELRRVRLNAYDPIGRSATWGSDGLNGSENYQRSFDNDGSDNDGYRRVWRYVGPKKNAPIVTEMLEDNIGPYEKRLLQKNTGHYFETKKHRRRRQKRKTYDDYR